MSEIFNSIQVSDEIDRFVDHSFDVVNKIHAILEKQGKTQRDLASLMGKSESEISKWMRGTHNFTLKSIAKIESVLGEKIVKVLKEDEMVVKKDFMHLYSPLVKNFEFTFQEAEVMEKPSHKTPSYAFKEVQVKVKEAEGKVEVSNSTDSDKSPKYDNAA